MRKITLISALLFLGASHSAALAKDACGEPELGSAGASMFSPPYAAVVIGRGRLQFYSAPSEACPMAGVFVLPKQEVVAYGVTRDDRWASVMYVDTRGSGNEAHGWVRFNRLRLGGTLGPKQ